MKRLLGIFSLLLVAAVACWPSMLVLHRLWAGLESGSHSHGYLIALITLGLICFARPALEAVPVRPVKQALALVVLATFAWLVFLRAGLQVLHLLMLPIIAATAVLAAFGWATLRILAFPLAFFVFALPVWEVLSSPLQQLTIHAQAVLIGLTGLPARVEGNLVHLPAGTFEIESGCSGLHFFVVGLALAALYGEMAKDSLRTRLVWLAFMGVLAVLSNWVRVFTIIVVGHRTNMQHYLVTVEHSRFGWMLFAALLVVFLLVTGRAARNRKRSDKHSTAHEQAPVPLHPAGPFAWTGAVLAVLALPSFIYARELAREDSKTVFTIEWPAARAPWRGPATAVNSDWRPHFEGASASGLWIYRDSDGKTAELFGVLYQHQQQNAELVGFANSLLGTDGALRAVNESVTQLASARWRETQVVDRDGRQFLVLWHYRIGDRIFVEPMASQMWYGLSVLSRPRSSALIAMRAQCAPDCQSARAHLESFAFVNCSSQACGVIVN